MACVRMPLELHDTFVVADPQISFALC